MTLRLAALLIITLSTQVACAAKQAAFEPSFAPQETAGAAEMKSPAHRELIKSASIEVLVPSVPASIEATTRLVTDAGGYVSNSIARQGSTAHLKLRVPAHQLTELLGNLAKLGEEKHRQVFVQDVTDQVADLDAVLTNKRALRDRLRLLLMRANDVKDIIAVEGELTRLQTEIDAIEGSLKRLRNDIAYSAVDLQLTPRAEEKPRKILGPLGYLFKGTGWVLKKLWVIRDGE
ncbi:MAG: hypothetical protein K0S46_2476 [Moraxellaceae bacterium]|jgi:hypothetical protein|nr:hypothetical protein [Moraxellaceae bacterium]